MTYANPEQIADQISQILRQALGPDLITLYLYGSTTRDSYQSGYSDINLLAIISDTAQLHALRQHLKPFWPDFAPIAHNTPTIIPHRRFQRHLDLHPTLAYRLKQQYTLLHGQDLLADLTPPLPPPHHELAYFTHEAAATACLLAPNLMEPENIPFFQKRLRNLHWTVTRQPAPANASPQILLAEIHHILDEKIANLGHIQRPPTSPQDDAPPILPQLRALYNKGEISTLLFPDPLTPHIKNTDWAEVGDLLAGEYEGINVSTPTQLHLALRVHAPLDHYLRRYEHGWGEDPLATLEFTNEQLYRTAARKPHDIQTGEFVHAYLLADDEEALHKIIHDFQNKLLNILLQNSLIARLEGKKAIKPPPLPDRTDPSPMRIDGIFNQLDWWSNYYYQQLQALTD